jgi:hypothetical protein
LGADGLSDPFLCRTSALEGDRRDIELDYDFAGWFVSLFVNAHGVTVDTTPLTVSPA